MAVKLQDKKEIIPVPAVPCNDEAIKNLLDVISSIIADEYIEVAKKNKEFFEIASGTSCPRNDKGGPK